MAHLNDSFDLLRKLSCHGDNKAAIKAAAGILKMEELMDPYEDGLQLLHGLPAPEEIPPPEQHTGKQLEYSDAQILSLSNKQDWGVTALDTDVAHARRLAEITNGDVRFNQKLGGYVCWLPDKLRWVTSEGGRGRGRGDLAAQAFAQRLSGHMRPEVARLFGLYSRLAMAGGRDNDAEAMRRAAWKLIKAQRAIEARARQKAALECLHPLVHIDHTVFEPISALIGFANGVWDAGVFREPRREDYLLYHSPVPYQPDADLTAWTEVLERMTGGNPDLALTLQDVAGYALSGQSSHRIIPWLYGPPASGKSTFTELLSTTLGEMAQAIDVAKLSSGSLRERLGADVWGKRLVLCHEAGRAHLDPELLKTLSGGDRLPVRKLYSEAFTTEPSHVLMMVSNDPPQMTAYDEGLRDRVLTLPFEHRLDLPGVPRLLGGARLELERRDPTSPLVSGFLRWAVEGLERFHRTGRIHRAQATITATRGFWQDTDPLKEFWLSFGPERLLDGVSPSELRQACEHWCREVDQHMPAKPQWQQACASVGLKQSHRGQGRLWKLVRVEEFPVAESLTEMVSSPG